MSDEPAPRPARVRMAAGVLLAILLAGCVSGSPGSAVVARSRLGVVTAGDLDRFIAGDPRWRRSGPERNEFSWCRARLEEYLSLAALAEEARRDRLLESGPFAVEWQRRRRAILVEEVERRMAGAAPPVGDEQVDAYLAGNPQELWRDEQLRLRHIFRHLPASSTEADRARARAEMEALRNELLQGADFGQLARERSDSQSAGFDGLIAPVGPGDLELVVDEAVWRLEVGEISEVVETATGLHIFRLEARSPAAGVPVEQVRARVRARLGQEARRAAADHAFAELLESSGAGYWPHLARSRDPETVVLELGSERLTVRELREQWSALLFAAQRVTSLEELLREDAWQWLGAWEAGRLNLVSDSAVVARLARAEEESLVSAASARWVDGVKARLSERELTDFVAGHEADFRRPAAWRLRAVLHHLESGVPPLQVYDQLDRLAASVRAGELDLGEAARLRSTDPSGDVGGDLGWVDAKTLAAWAGGRFLDRVRRLAVGELSDPLLVEVYEPERLRYRADAYALVRVEDVRPEGTPPLLEVRAQAIDSLLGSRTQEIRAELRRRILQSIDATVDEEALAAKVQADRLGTYATH